MTFVTFPCFFEPRGRAIRSMTEISFGMIELSQILRNLPETQTGTTGGSFQRSAASLTNFSSGLAKNTNRTQDAPPCPNYRLLLRKVNRFGLIRTYPQDTDARANVPRKMRTATSKGY